MSYIVFIFSFWIKYICIIYFILTKIIIYTNKYFYYIKKWRERRGSNSRPLAWQASVLTNWTTPPHLYYICIEQFIMSSLLLFSIVVICSIYPISWRATFPIESGHSHQLNYTPAFFIILLLIIHNVNSFTFFLMMVIVPNKLTNDLPYCIVRFSTAELHSCNIFYIKIPKWFAKLLSIFLTIIFMIL